MKSTYPVTEAQTNLPKLLKSKKILSISRRGEVVSFLVPKERMEAILETMEILATPEAMESIRKDQSGQGTYYSLEELEKQLDKGA